MKFYYILLNSSQNIFHWILLHLWLCHIIMDAKYIVECIAIILFNLTESELYLQGEPVSVQTVFRSVWSGVTSAPMERDPAHFKPGSEPTSAYEVLTVQTDYHWETRYTHTTNSRTAWRVIAFFIQHA